MPRYIYVVVLDRGEDEPVAFRHTFVEVVDPDPVAAAYRAGFHQVELKPGEARINDYVAELP